MPGRKVDAVSIESVAKSVESAIKLAAARHNLAVDKTTLLNRWEIIGRRLKDVKDMDVAFRFASDVSSKVKVPGLAIVPVVTKIGKDILVGFIERSNIPKTL